MHLKRALILMILFLVILSGSLLFGKILGEYYLYNLLFADNLPEIPKMEHMEKIMVFRSEPITFYTLQLGISADLKVAQQMVDGLLSDGIRPFVTKKAPYKIWAGCFAQANLGNGWKTNFKEMGYEVFLGEGLIGDRAFKFKESDIFARESFAPLLREYHLLFSNSLQMFIGPNYLEYSSLKWEEMINKMGLDIETLSGLTKEILAMEEGRIYQKNLEALGETLDYYEQSLDLILQSPSDQIVINSQNRLLELIASYHNLILEANKFLIK